MRAKKYQTLAIVVMVVIICAAIAVYRIHGIGAKTELYRAIRENDYDSVKSVLNVFPFLANEHEDTWLFFVHISESPGYTPLLLACDLQHDEIARLLVERGADVNKSSNNAIPYRTYPIFKALAKDNFDMVWYLIDYGADLSLTNYYGSIPLEISYKCIHNDDIEKAEELLKIFKYTVERGVSLDDPEIYEEHQSVFKYAVHNYNYLIVEYLLENELFNVNEKNINGDNALVTMLSSDVEYVKKSIEMPQFYKSFENECRETRYKTCEVLIKYGVDVSFRDSYDKTALDYATELGDERLISLLQLYS